MTDQKSLEARQKNFRYQIWLMLIIVFGVIAAGFGVMAIPSPVKICACRLDAVEPFICISAIDSSGRTE